MNGPVLTGTGHLQYPYMSGLHMSILVFRSLANHHELKLHHVAAKMVCPMIGMDPVKCECPFETDTSCIMHVGGSTYYRGLGMIQNKGVLFSAPLKYSGFHFTKILLTAIDSKQVRNINLREKALTLISLAYSVEDDGNMINRQFAFLLKGMRYDLGILSCLRRIQRAVRAFIKPRRQERFIALAMGLHPRLGEGSVVNALYPDVLYSVFISTCG